MSYEVEYPKNVDKRLAALPLAARQALISALERFAADPLRMDIDVRKVRGTKDQFRIRCGNYRLLFKLNKGVLEVLKASDRKDAY